METEREIPVDQLDKLIRERQLDPHHALLAALQSLFEANSLTDYKLGVTAGYAYAKDALLECLQFVREEGL